MESKRGKRRGRKSKWTRTRAALNKLEDLLKCTLCSNKLKEPCVIGSCEHVFCKSCVQEFLGKHCPKCKVPVLSKEMHNDLLITNVVNYTAQLHNIVDKSPSTSKEDSSDIGSDSNEEIINQNNTNEKLFKPEVNKDSNCNNTLTPTTVGRPRRKLRPSETSIASASPVSNQGPGLKLKRNIKGETPLHLAAIKGDVVTIRRLLHQGANPNEKDNAGWTPLHEACHHGHTKIVEILLENNAFIDVPACDNETPLHDAVSMDQPEIVTLLVSRGANINVRNSQGLTPGDMVKSEEVRAALNAPRLANVEAEKGITSLSPLASRQNSSQSENIILLGTGLSDEQQQELLTCGKVLKADVVEEFYDDVTHVIAECDDNGHCQRTMKFMMAVLTGKWILNYTWVDECIAFKRKVYEEPYEVLGNKKQQSTHGPRRARLNAANQFPPLFDGCSFFFHGTFEPPSPNRETLMSLVKQGGGNILNREPRPRTDEHLSVPYHATKDANGTVCSSNQFIIYQEFLPQRLKNLHDQNTRCETVMWLLNCISTFKILPPQST